MKWIEEDEKKKQKIISICETYLSIESSVEVNIGFQTRGILERKLKNLTNSTMESKEFDNFFEEVERDVEKNMKDSMNRFLFSEDFLSLNIILKIEAELSSEIAEELEAAKMKKLSLPKVEEVQIEILPNLESKEQESTKEVEMNDVQVIDLGPELDEIEPFNMNS
jgi:hypothetical protein